MENYNIDDKTEPLLPSRPRITINNHEESFHIHMKGLKAGKHIGALAYSETTAKSSQRSVGDVIEIAALSSAGNKNSTEAPNFKRQRSFMRRKRFSGLNDTKSQLRKDVVKSCVVM
uniref:Uncharacterized protein n=1 Tax=Octopus bimaculoides TaxID=37653 RepID=A0A0L8FJU7_OCTBM